MAPQGDNAPPATYVITVGKVAHRFSPEVLTAKVGDTLSFEFFPANHSVIRSTWDNPCLPYERMIPASQRDIQGPIWSHFNPVTQVVDDADMPWFNITVKTTNPLYIYCGAPGSCNQSGMVMIVNPTSDKNITGFRRTALKAPFVLVPGESFPTGEGTGTPVAATPTPTPSTPSSSTASVLPQVTTVTSTPVAAKSTISVGAIAGIAIGGVAVLAILGILAFLIVTRRRSKREILQLPPTPTQQPFGYGGASPALSPAQPPTQTIIIPMTEAEKMMYLEKIGRGDGVVSPMSPDRLGPDRQQYGDGTMTSTQTDISRSTTGRGNSGAPRPPPPIVVNEGADPARWQLYGTIQSPAEMGPGDSDIHNSNHNETAAATFDPANEAAQRRN